MLKKRNKFNAVKRIFNVRVWFVIAILTFALAMTITYITHEIELATIQSNALNELNERKGEYDENVIVLHDTTFEEANELSEKLNATLRITEDGSFGTLTLNNTTVYDIYSSKENRELLSKFSLDYQVEMFEDDTSLRLPTKPIYNVTDTDYSMQTYLDYLNLQNTWSNTTGQDITVAVIDTGIDTDHLEFQGKISEYSYNASEDKIVKDYQTGNGEYDWSLIEDEQGHGTEVTGVIAASMNGMGIVGLSPSVNILVIKARRHSDGSFVRGSDLVFGLYYAIERDVDVINMSFGASINVFAGAAKLAKDSDIICVAAAGNDASTALTYPAADPNVIGVGSLDTNSWDLAPYSNYGENVNVVAPGTVYTTKIGGGYGPSQGTSLSSPIVAGAVALYLSRYKYQEFSAVTEVLYASSYDLGGIGNDWTYGYGALDINAFINEERGTVTFNTLTEEVDTTTQVFIRNHTLQDIPEPEREYTVFDGWYYDRQFTEELNWYEDVFTTDLTLYAKWVNEDEGIPYTYVTLPDGTIEIRSYTGKRRYITIPDMIEGKVVSSIGDFAFLNQTRLRTINLPTNLKKIGICAFQYCNNLLSIQIPDTVETIGASAFSYNNRLANISFTDQSKLTQIGNYAFSYCSSLTRFEIPRLVENINGSMFFGDTSLRAISVMPGNTKYTSVDGVLLNIAQDTIIAYPAGKGTSYEVLDSITSIGDYAFAYARFTTIDLNNVSVIGGSAFEYSNLESVEIPDAVQKLAENTFRFNFNLKSVSLGKGIEVISGCCFSNCSSLNNVVIPKNVIAIGHTAFQKNSALTNITFEEGSKIERIDESAFYHSSLIEITLPSSLKQIGGGAFDANRSLRKVTLADDSALLSIGEYAFKDTRITTFTIPSKVESVGVGAFASCHSLTSINVVGDNNHYVDIDGVLYDKNITTIIAYPAGNANASYVIDSNATKINDAAFYGSYNLESVTLPSSLETIPYIAFYECINITNYQLPSTLMYIETEAFANNISLASMQIPDNVIQISNNAFYSDFKLTSVTFTENSKLPRISYGAFAYTGLTSFEVPNSVSTIGQGAFIGCSNLKTITFKENSPIESISAYMFNGCSNLKTITFKNGSKLTNIQAHGLEGMSKLETINFGNANITNIDNFAFRYCESLKNITIPSNVNYIGRYAFYGCKSLTTLSLPTTLEYIGRYAFYGASNLNVYFDSDNLPTYLQEGWDEGINGYYVGVSNVVSTDDWDYALLNSGNISIIRYKGSSTSVDLTTLTSELGLSGTITSIGGNAFYRSNVTSIILPDTLTTIQSYAFARSSIEEIIIPKSVSHISKYAFFDTPLRTITFENESSINNIEQYAFSYCDNLSSISLPSNLNNLGSYAFYNSGLTEVLFANDSLLTEISGYAFSNTSLESLVLPNSIQEISYGAFSDNPQLSSVQFGTSELGIMENAFYNTGLKTINIPSNVSYIGEYAFSGIDSLEAFNVSEDNPYFSSYEGVLYNKTKTKIISVPPTITGTFNVLETVESIGFGAFEGSSIEEINFPLNTNILTIGYRAFYGLRNLKQIVIPKSVISIDFYAFANCINLETVEFEQGSRLSGVYEGAFYGCSSLKNITLPQTIEEISDYTFYSCSSLEVLPIAEGSQIKGIFNYAFAYTSIKELVLPDTLIDIGAYAFRGIKAESITVSDANKEQLLIGIGAFRDCNKLKEITLPFIGASYEDQDITWFGYIFGAGSYTGNDNYVPKSLKTITITEGITEVGRGGFYGLTSVEKINIPHSVTTLSDESFRDTLASYEFTNTIYFNNSFGYSIFSEGLSGHLVLGEELTEIGSFIFRECNRLVGITLPDSVKSIDDRAFEGCASLVSIIIPEGVTSIGSTAFNSCWNLTSVTIPSSVTNIDVHAFYCCEKLAIVYNHSNLEFTFGSTDNGGIAEYAKVIHLSDGTTLYKEGKYVYIDTEDGFRFSLYNGVYTLIAYLGTQREITLPSDILGNEYRINLSHNSNITSVIIPEGIKSIDEDAFEWCGNLKSVSISNSVTSIGDNAFLFCQSLTNITIPESVKTIGYGAFTYCMELKSINIPDGVTSIGANAFQGCKSLTSIIIPASVTNMGRSIFSECFSLEYVQIDTNNKYYSYSEGIIYNANKTEILFVLPGTSSITLLKSVSKITGDVFFGLEDLVDVYYQGTINDWCKIDFDEGNSNPMASAENIYMLNQNNEYYEVKGTLTIPSGITTIKQYSFFGFKNIEEIIIPNGVKTIEDSVFWDCRGLKTISIPDSVKSIGWYAFTNCSSLTSIEIPIGVRAIELGTFSSCSNLTSVIIPNSVTIIKSSAFSGCMSLTNIDIPDSVTIIEEHAFSFCRSLTSIIVPSKVTCIENYTYSNCVGLTDVIIPAGIATIEEFAFSYCTNLTSITIPGSVTKISENAFYDCSKLYVIHNNSSLEFTFDSTDNGSIAKNAKVIHLNDGKTLYKDSEFVYIDTTDGFRFSLYNGVYTLIAYFGKSREITLPLNILGNSYMIDLSKNNYITSIIIPEGMTSINHSAFRECVKLVSVTLPESLNEIGIMAFTNCASLTNIIIPDGVTNIGYCTFMGCTKLENISIPESVTSIDSTAFRDTKYYNDESNWADQTLYLGNCLIGVDKNADTITVKPNTKVIAYDAFEDCIKITHLIISGMFERALSPVQNLETLEITGSLRGYSIYQYFSPSNVPMTLKNIVLNENADIDSFTFSNISGVNIYVDRTSLECLWDEDYPNWNYGNKVYYNGEWINILYYDRNDNLISNEYLSTAKMIITPYADELIDDKYLYTFVGWDIDGDGTVDGLPPTSITNMIVKAIYISQYRCDTEGHNYGEWLVTTQATCTETGSRYHNCTICGETEEEVVAKLNHSYENVVTRPTCTTQGYTTHTCGLCGDSFTDTYTSIVNHSYKNVVTSPTCTEKGYTTHTCSQCGDSYVDTYTDIIDHNPSEWIVDKTATTTEEGHQYKECSECHQVLEEQAISKLEKQSIFGNCRSGVDMSFMLNMFGVALLIFISRKKNFNI